MAFAGLGGDRATVFLLARVKQLIFFFFKFMYCEVTAFLFLC